MEQNRYGNFDLELDSGGAFRLLGQGTFGRTYLARHRFLDTPAALKVINARYAAEPQARERFLSEARSVAKLDHKHIARVLDFGEAGGVLFYALEYCGGGTLEQHCAAAGGLAEGDWFAVARQVAGALACCHEAGFIHRDIKPSNLMLAQAGGPLLLKLIDFGLVRSSRKTSPGAEAGDGAGSPLYASPEQLREEALDARSDLFSLGMSLWHAAIGRAPDTGTTRQIIERRLDGRGYAGDLPKTLPQTVRAILEVLLQKDPASRPQSAKDLLRLLEGAAVGTTPAAATVGGGERAASRIDVTVLQQDLESEFEIVRTEGEQATGIHYTAKSLLPGGGPVWLHAIHPRLWAGQEFREQVVRNIGGIAGLETQLLLKLVGVREYRDYTVVVAEPPAGVPLLAELKSAGKLAFASCVEFLGRVAADLDRLSVAGLPAADLRPGQIYCEKGGLTGSGILTPTLVPQFVSSGSLESDGGSGSEMDASATMAPEAMSSAGGSDSPLGPFARLVYRMTAGRDCVAAASLSVQAYVAVPELSEEGNRFLSRVIAGVTVPPSCAALLATLTGTEGVSGAGSSSGFKKPAAPAKAAAPVVAVEVQTPVAEKGSQEVPAPVESRPSNAGAKPVAPVAGPVVAATATPPPVDPPAPKAKAAPAQSKESKGVAVEGSPAAAGRSAKLWGGVGLLGIGLAAVWFFATPGRLPEGAVVRIDGDLPGHSQFKVNGTAVTPSRSGRAWEVPLGGGVRLPVSVVFEAAGYEKFPFEIVKASQLKESVAVKAKRARGVLVFKPNGRSDYDHFAVELEEALPGEEAADLRKGERIGDSLRDAAESRVELPTGQYLLTLGGAPSVISGFSPEQRLSVKAGESVVFNLPPSYSGRYKGEGEQGGVELKLERELRSGELTFELSGTEKTGKVRRCKLDNRGVLNAEFLDAAGGVPWDVTAKLSADGEGLQVELVSRGANSVPQTFRLQRVRER